MNSLEYKIHSWSVISPHKIALIDKKRAFTYKELFENIWASKRLLELGFRNPNFIIEQKNYDYAADMQIESYPEEIVISFINSCR